MKNVLIITFSFPPMPEVAAVRPEGLANYLPSYGWNPIFLTPHLPEDPDPRYTVVQTGYDDILAYWCKKLHLPLKKAKPGADQGSKERLMKLYNIQSLPPFVKKMVFLPAEIFVYPDLHIGWYEHAVEAGKRILESHQIDAIISSSKPNTCHLIAHTLAEIYNVPWIADFRDLWTQNHFLHYSAPRKQIEKKLELRTIQSAAALTTVSDPLAKNLGVLHKNSSIYTIPNGFDPGVVCSDKPQTNRFTILYTGTIYYGFQDPVPLLNAIKRIVDSHIIPKGELHLDFYGGDNEWLEKTINNYSLQDIVTLHGRVPREKAIEEQRRAQILLLLTWNDPAEEGVYTGKLFDYLAAKRPILSIGHTGGGVVNELLDQTGAGVHISDEDDLNAYLLQSYKEFKEKGSVSYYGIHEEIMKYSHIEMARKFAYVLDTVCNSHNKPDGE